LNLVPASDHWSLTLLKAFSQKKKNGPSLTTRGTVFAFQLKLHLEPSVHQARQTLSCSHNRSSPQPRNRSWLRSRNRKRLRSSRASPGGL
jgi:hypothetical protein